MKASKMQHVKITHAGRDSRLNVGFIYSLEHLQSGLLRLTSVGGRFSTLVNQDTSPVEFEYVDSPPESPLKGWRNTYAVNLWNEVYLDGLSESMSPDAAASWADSAVEQFKKRWEGTTFLHNVEQEA